MGNRTLSITRGLCLVTAVFLSALPSVVIAQSSSAPPPPSVLSIVRESTFFREKKPEESVQQLVARIQSAVASGADLYDPTRWTPSLTWSRSLRRTLRGSAQPKQIWWCKQCFLLVETSTDRGKLMEPP